MAKNRIKKKCECAMCDSDLSHEEMMAKMRQWEEKMMAEYGWYAHMVGDDDEGPTGYNAHTHGLETDGLLNFQIVCPLPGNVANAILARLVERARKEKLEAGMELDKIIGDGYKVRLVLAEECGRRVLRAIMPDKDGKFGDEAEEPYGDQMKGCLPVG